MGNQFTSEDQLSQSFQQQYTTFNQYPYLINKSTGQPFTIHKVTTNSPQQTHKVLESVQTYKASRCASISNLKQYYHKQNKSYCSDRQNIYFLFYDHSKNTIKDQYLLRRFAEHKFSPQEIQTILSAMLCGIRQYSNKFLRVHKPMILENLCIQQKTHRLYVKDPWLSPLSTTNSFTGVMLTYPSPEKLNALYQDKESFYDQYYSQLFTIGMLGLQLNQMDFVDQIYNKKKKQIDNQKLNIIIDSLSNDYNLKKGIRTLLQQKPARRNDIFHQWKINCQIPKKLDRLQKQFDRQIVNFSNNKSIMKNQSFDDSSNRMTGYFNQKNNIMDYSFNKNLNSNMNQTDFRLSRTQINNNNYYNKGDAFNHQSNVIQQINGNVIPVNINKDKINYSSSILQSFGNLNSQVSRDKTAQNYSIKINNINLNGRQFEKKTQNKQGYNQSFYHNKSTSNLLYPNYNSNIKFTEQIINKNENNNNKKSRVLFNKNNNFNLTNNQYNFTKSKSYQSQTINNYIPYLPQLQVSFSNTNNNNNTKLLKIKKPAQSLNNININYKKIIQSQKDTTSFNHQYNNNNTAKYNQTYNNNTSFKGKNNNHQPIINSFNSNNINNTLKFQQDKNNNQQFQLNSVRNNFIQRLSNYNANGNISNISNTQNYQISQHSSSLGKQSKDQLNTNNFKSFDIANGRQRSISNQVNSSFLNSLSNNNDTINLNKQKYVNKNVSVNIPTQNILSKDRNFSQYLSLDQNTNIEKYKLDNYKFNNKISNAETKNYDFGNRKGQNNNQNNFFSTIQKDINQNNLALVNDLDHQQSQPHQSTKFQTFSIDNIIKSNTKQQIFENINNFKNTKQQEKKDIYFKNLESKSPINQWKNVQEQNKKLISPQKGTQSTQISTNNYNKSLDNITEIPARDRDKGIINQIKSYADNLFSFKTNQLTNSELKKTEKNEQKQQQNQNFIQNNLSNQNGSKDTTPNRPTNKNKYNSTIIQVNEETPQASQNSNQGQVQYVIQQYQTGSKYQGEKVNGMRSGKGKFYYQDGGHYEGQWKNNKMHGWGKLFYQGGRLAYEGHWSHDQFHGYGKVYNDNPILLDGPFDYTNFDMLDDFWIYYQGTLVSDTKQGRGKIKLTNGQVFEGDFHADRIQGFGKYYTLDNNFIEGIWRQSKLIKVLQTS